jgi:hypothetical protein
MDIMDHYPDISPYSHRTRKIFRIYSQSPWFRIYATGTLLWSAPSMTSELTQYNIYLAEVHPFQRVGWGWLGNWK